MRILHLEMQICLHKTQPPQTNNTNSPMVFTSFQLVLTFGMLFCFDNAYSRPHDNHNAFCLRDHDCGKGRHCTLGTCQHGPGRHHGPGGHAGPGGPGGAGGMCVLDANCRHGELCDFGRCIHGVRESVLRSGPGRRRAACFHGSSQVRLEDGTVKPIDQIQAGQKVASVDDEGDEVFVDVVYVPHLQNSMAVSFLRLTCTEGTGGASSTLFMTPEHFIFRSSAGATFGEAAAIRADHLSVGDWLWQVESSSRSDRASTMSPCEIVEDVSVVNNLEGAYTLFTENGRFIVDDVVVSSYADSPLQYYGHDLAHQAMFLHRFVHSIGQSSSTWFRYANDNILEPLAVV